MFFPLKELRINREITKLKWVRYDDLSHKKILQKWDDEKVVGDEFLKDQTKALSSLEGEKLTVIDTHPNHNGQQLIFERVIFPLVTEDLVQFGFQNISLQFRLPSILKVEF